MKASIHNWLRKAKRRIQKRLRPKRWTEQPRPMLAARNICYEVAERTSGLAAGGIGAMHLLAQRSGLVKLIDTHLHLLKRHLPYHESDHVLNLAYNGQRGYHPLLISLANTGEPLYVVNRSGNRPSAEGAAAYFDRAVKLCRRAGDDPDSLPDRADRAARGLSAVGLEPVGARAVATGQSVATSVAVLRAAP